MASHDLLTFIYFRFSFRALKKKKKMTSRGEMEKKLHSRIWSSKNKWKRIRDDDQGFTIYWFSIIEWVSWLNENLNLFKIKLTAFSEKIKKNTRFHSPFLRMENKRTTKTPFLVK